jgi:hypothetical protein
MTGHFNNLPSPSGPSGALSPIRARGKQSECCRSKSYIRITA